MSNGAEHRFNGGLSIGVHCTVDKHEAALSGSSSSVAISCEFSDFSHIRFSMGDVAKLAEIDSSEIPCRSLDRL